MPCFMAARKMHCQEQPLGRGQRGRLTLSAWPFLSPLVMHAHTPRPALFTGKEESSDEGRKSIEALASVYSASAEWGTVRCSVFCPGRGRQCQLGSSLCTSGMLTRPRQMKHRRRLEGNLAAFPKVQVQYIHGVRRSVGGRREDV